MAVTTIYATSSTSGRGFISGAPNSDWDDAITAASGTVSSSQSNGFAARAGVIGGRGGNLYYVNRAFAYFVTNTIETTITAATVKVQGTGTPSGGTVGIYASSAFGNNGSTLAGSDFDNVQSSLLSSNTYSSVTWNTSGLNSFVLNATAITALNNNGYLNIAFRMSNEVDEEEPEETDNYIGINFGSGSQSYRIQVECTHADAGYSNSVIGVSSIGSVEGVSSANISTVIGV